MRRARGGRLHASGTDGRLTARPLARSSVRGRHAWLVSALIPTVLPLLASGRATPTLRRTGFHDRSLGMLHLERFGKRIISAPAWPLRASASVALADIRQGRRRGSRFAMNKRLSIACVSRRGYGRASRVARTIADLGAAPSAWLHGMNMARTGVSEVCQPGFAVPSLFAARVYERPCEPPAKSIGKLRISAPALL